MAKETIAVTSWEEVGPALAAGQRPLIGFACGLCGQRVAEEFHSLTVTTYHRVAEEECERLRAALQLLWDATDDAYWALGQRTGSKALARERLTEGLGDLRDKWPELAAELSAKKGEQ